MNKEELKKLKTGICALGLAGILVVFTSATLGVKGVTLEKQPVAVPSEDYNCDERFGFYSKDGKVVKKQNTNLPCPDNKKRVVRKRVNVDNRRA